MPTLKDFDYELPRALIAPYPEPKRSEARLLVLDRTTQRMEHRIFRNLSDYLRAGDLLVLNNTKVLPARLFGRKPTGGRVEVLLLKKEEPLVWEILLKPSGRVKKGTRLVLGENGTTLEGEILDEPRADSGVRQIRFYGDGSKRDRSERLGTSNLSLREPSLIQERLREMGRIPLPPYLDRADEEIDREFYQTVFAQVEGAVASPTAGLHFDEPLLDTLRDQGVEICFVTLHVSYGTFQPVQTEDLSKHEIYEEEFEIKEEAAAQIQRALEEKRRIVACGTTVVRVLETTAQVSQRGGASRRWLPQPMKGTTRLFIYPPYQFELIDAMITNFHLPRSTLLMLVSAFGGRELIFRAYAEAIHLHYRFYSYGDAMLIL